MASCSVFEVVIYVQVILCLGPLVSFRLALFWSLFYDEQKGSRTALLLLCYNWSTAEEKNCHFFVLSSDTFAGPKKNNQIRKKRSGSSFRRFVVAVRDQVLWRQSQKKSEKFSRHDTDADTDADADAEAKKCSFSSEQKSSLCVWTIFLTRSFTRNSWTAQAQCLNYKQQVS